VRGLVIIGPPGAGKTTLLTALHDVLVDKDVRHAVVELEGVAWTHPPLDESRALAHLHAVVDSYVDAGFELVVVAATTTSPDHLRVLLDVLPSADFFIARLEARVETLQARIRSREPDGWSGLASLLAATESLAATSAGLDADIVCSTENVSPAELAARILAASPFGSLPSDPATAVYFPLRSISSMR
jgi:chloramphenicol 3-O-phosphotransferase